MLTMIEQYFGGEIPSYPIDRASELTWHWA